MGCISVRNGLVLLADGRIDQCDVLIDSGLITEIGGELRAECEIDATNCYVLPGLVDLHVHGMGRESTSLSSLADIAQLEASRGATTFYPTLFAPPDEIATQLRRHRRETDDLRAVPQVAGFRLESPYLANASGGLPKDCAPISEETTEMLLDAGGGLIKIWDISPELPGALSTTSRLTSLGVVVSLAHTAATIDQARAAVECGARLVTHLFDTFRQPMETEPGAYPAGLVDYLLVEDRVVCEIIGDGTHVHPLLVEKAFRCKTPNRLAFVTDSNVGAGLPPGRYELPMGWGTAQINGPNDGVRLVDRGMELCGSALTPIDAFRNVVNMFEKDLATASTVCSRTPAKLMGLNKGELAPGRDGDVIIVTRNLNLVCTIVSGRIVWQI
ncbi:MAG: amidohydrolase family protein [Armatimonadota bacterium]|nr:amidohydrolase family protein [Armatimonadota bacterium]